jgi:hypothetical protein
MTAELAARAGGGPAECAGVEVEYVDPDRGRERRPLSVCWSSRFERVGPVRGFASFRGQRNWPGWWWFSRIDGSRAPEPDGLTDRELRRDLNAAEHAELARLYDDGTISQATRKQLQRSLDLEAARLSEPR